MSIIRTSVGSRHSVSTVRSSQLISNSVRKSLLKGSESKENFEGKYLGLKRRVTLNPSLIRVSDEDSEPELTIALSQTDMQDGPQTPVMSASFIRRLSQVIQRKDVIIQKAGASKPIGRRFTTTGGSPAVESKIDDASTVDKKPDTLPSSQRKSIVIHTDHWVIQIPDSTSGISDISKIPSDITYSLETQAEQARSSSSSSETYESMYDGKCI